MSKQKNPKRTPEFYKADLDLSRARKAAQKSDREEAKRNIHYIQIDPEAFFKVHKKCYFAEARAMLEGKHWQGKNKCVKLPGDVDTLK